MTHKMLFISDLLHDFEHCKHLKGFYPVWVIRWILRWDEPLKLKTASIWKVYLLYEFEDDLWGKMTNWMILETWDEFLGEMTIWMILDIASI